MSRNVSLTVPYSTQQQELDRRRQLAMLLQQQSMEPLETPRHPGAQISPYSGLAKILQSFTGNYKEGRLNKEQRSLDTERNESQRAEMARLLNTGTPPQPAGAQPSWAPPQTQGMLSPQSSLASALSSQHPAVQQVGGAMMQDQAQDARTRQQQGFQRALMGEEAALQAQDPLRQAQARNLTNPQPQAGMGTHGTYYQSGPQAGQVIEPAPQAPPVPRNIDPNSPEGISARLDFERRKPPTASDRRPVGVQTLDAQGNPVTRFVDPQVGDTFSSQPSDREKQSATQYKKAEPVLNSISELSEKINTGAGLSARAVGEAAKLKAKANYDDDVAEYQSLIAGFTPMVARALGHTGVLTQQDVDSVKELFPKPGESKTLRDRKTARIKKVLGEINDVLQPGAGAPPSAGGGGLIVPGGALERLMQGR